MIRILLCGEGQHEIGVNLAGETAAPGWMQTLITRLTDKRLTFGVKRRKELFLPEKRQKRLKPLPPGHGAKALLSKILAADEFDIVVFMVDADSKEQKRWSEIVAEIEEGFGRDNNQKVEGVACVPMSTSESWLLADQAAWTRLGLKEVSKIPTAPEQQWGARDSQGHPHNVFSAACDDAGVEDNYQTRSLLASGSEIEAIARQCPTSFPPFRKNLRGAIEGIDGCNCGEECCE